MSVKKNADPIVEKLGAILIDRGETLAVAESCSGGYLAHQITRVAGSSTFFLGGVVSYSNSAKHSLLGVSKESLEQFGAVSEQVCTEMLKGALNRFGADYALATTGIAGPGGGSPEKPVGLVYVGVALADTLKVERCLFEGSRIDVIQQSATHAFQLLAEIIQAE